jgi:alpha 1,2-mannosyltransferase
MLLKWRARGSQKYAQALTLVFVVLLLYQAISKSDIVSDREGGVKQQSPSEEPQPFLQQQAKFWRALYSHVLNNDPQCAAPEVLGIPHKLDTGYDPKHDIPRPDVLWLNPQDVDKIKAAHAQFLQDIHDKSPTIPFQPGTQGIAVTASYQLLPVLAISLRMLRRTGCTLPVEVFLATSEDYDSQVCDDMFTSLNAKCLIFQSITTSAGTGVTLSRYQYKIMALLFSSFESVLLLDSDAFPVTSPTSLFSTAPLSTHGLILFPDFWYPTESPYFFTIASITPIPPLNARPATESGAVLVHKPTHTATLLLAAYYNYYGPDLYYPLQSQGAPGQGDKETFGWAAVATNSSFYKVHTPVLALGHLDSSGAFVGSAMAQHDPIADFALHHHGDGDDTYPAPLPAGPATAAPSADDATTPSSVPPLFIHANFPKFDPATLFLSTTQPPGKAGPTFDSNGTKVRPWSATVLIGGAYGPNDGGGGGRGGEDVERAFWEEIEWVACEWQNGFGAWEGIRREGVDVCKVVRNWVGEVFGDVEDVVSKAGSGEQMFGEG